MRVADRNEVRHRPTVAVVDLDAVRHNVRALKPPGAELMAVVKANAYGHGDVPVARAALEAGATWLGVALVEEGLRLRDHGVDAPVLVLAEFPPGSEREALAARLTPCLYTDGGLARLAAAATAVGVAPGVHVKVDTGMHRVGLPPGEAGRFVAEVRAAGLPLEGLWTHLATGGTGDVLTGAAAAFVARGLSPADAAVLAAFVHGVAGELAWAESGEGTIASDVLERLPAAVDALRRLGDERAGFEDGRSSFRTGVESAP